MKSTFDWAHECQYISNMVDVARGLRAPDDAHNMRDFNYRQEVLAKYLQVQSKAAERAGRHDSVAYIEQCLDDLR
jgi:hypothetical protein